ncbi:MAG: carbonic anhydrase [Nitriliruptorales bacterium]|nr:carbonic anhydrase [Nitriliruptorales bacterium]
MTAIDDCLEAAAPEQRGHFDAPPTRQLAVLTCMDARLDPLRDLGIELGEAHVIRNAGGRATDDALRSLLLSWHTLGTREVLIVHHTTCGVRTDDEDALRSRLEETTGASLDDVILHTFDDDEQAVRDDVATITSSPFAPPDLVVRGALHDLAAGEIREIAAGQ